MIQCINDNAYKIDILLDKYFVSDIFNVSDLAPYHGDEDQDPRVDLSPGGGCREPNGHPHGYRNPSAKWTND